MKYRIKSCYNGDVDLYEGNHILIFWWRDYDEEYRANKTRINIKNLLLIKTLENILSLTRALNEINT